jgi:hypothetical protein
VVVRKGGGKKGEKDERSDLLYRVAIAPVRCKMVNGSRDASVQTIERRPRWRSVQRAWLKGLYPTAHFVSNAEACLCTAWRGLDGADIVDYSGCDKCGRPVRGEGVGKGESERRFVGGCVSGLQAVGWKVHRHVILE